MSRSEPNDMERADDLLRELLDADMIVLRTFNGDVARILARHLRAAMDADYQRGRRDQCWADGGPDSDDEPPS